MVQGCEGNGNFMLNLGCDVKILHMDKGERTLYTTFFWSFIKAHRNAERERNGVK